MSHGDYLEPLIRAMDECVHPEPAARIADPTCGTDDFFLAVYDFITSPDNITLCQRQSAPRQKERGHLLKRTHNSYGNQMGPRVPIPGRLKQIPKFSTSYCVLPAAVLRVSWAPADEPVPGTVRGRPQSHETHLPPSNIGTNHQPCYPLSSYIQNESQSARLSAVRRNLPTSCRPLGGLPSGMSSFAFGTERTRNHDVRNYSLTPRLQKGLRRDLKAALHGLRGREGRNFPIAQSDRTNREIRLQRPGQESWESQQLHEEVHKRTRARENRKYGTARYQMGQVVFFRHKAPKRYRPHRHGSRLGRRTNRGPCSSTFGCAARRWSKERVPMKISEVMVANPTCAESWQTLADLRRTMLVNDFSMLPMRNGTCGEPEKWRAVRAEELAAYLLDNRARP